MNRYRSADNDDDDPSDDEADQGWYDNSHGYDGEDEDEEYEEFIEREFGSGGSRSGLRPLYFWAAIAVLVSFCLPLLLMLVQILLS